MLYQIRLGLQALSVPGMSSVFMQASQGQWNGRRFTKDAKFHLILLTAAVILTALSIQAIYTHKMSPRSQVSVKWPL